MSKTLKERLGKLNRDLRMQLFAVVLPLTMTPSRDSFGGGHSEAITSEEGTRKRDDFRRESETYIEPPKPIVRDTVFSDIYQAEIPRDLYEAGIEEVDFETGEAILGIRGIIGNVANWQESAGSYRGLDFQDMIMGMYAALGDHLEKVDETALTEKLGGDNPIVKLVQSAGRSYEATVGRKTHLEALTEQNPNDMTSVLNRYYG